MYHPTIRQAKPNISFSQSPLCHIPSMNVGLKTKPIQVSSGFTAIPTRFLGPKKAWMLSNLSTYTVRNFQVSQSLGFIVYPTILQLRIPRPNIDSTLQDLPYIPSFIGKGFLGLIEGTHLQDLLYLLPFTGLGFLDPPRHTIFDFTATHICCQDSKAFL